MCYPRGANAPDGAAMAFSAGLVGMLAKSLDMGARKKGRGLKALRCCAPPPQFRGQAVHDRVEMRRRKPDQIAAIGITTRRFKWPRNGRNYAISRSLVWPTMGMDESWSAIFIRTAAANYFQGRVGGLAHPPLLHRPNQG